MLAIALLTPSMIPSVTPGMAPGMRISMAPSESQAPMLFILRLNELNLMSSRQSGSSNRIQVYRIEVQPDLMLLNLTSFLFDFRC